MYQQARRPAASILYDTMYRATYNTVSAMYIAGSWSCAVLRPVAEVAHATKCISHTRTHISKAMITSAQSMSLVRSANAISGSIIQNSARWRDVLLFSALKVGPACVKQCDLHSRVGSQMRLIEHPAMKHR